MAIIRLSGPDAVAIAGAVFRGGGGAAWPPTSHRLCYGTAVGADGAVLDEVGAPAATTRAISTDGTMHMRRHCCVGYCQTFLLGMHP